MPLLPCCCMCSSQIAVVLVTVIYSAENPNPKSIICSVEVLQPAVIKGDNTVDLQIFSSLWSL